MFKHMFVKKHKKSVYRYVARTIQISDSNSEIKYSRKKQPSTEESSSAPKNAIRYSMELDVDSIGLSPSKPSKKDKFDSLGAYDIIRRIIDENKSDKTIEEVTNISFVEKLLEHIKNKKMRETQVYKSALMDRRLFSKIISNVYYKPSKDTVIALALALKLSLDEAKDLLERAGYSLSHSITRDIVIEYFLSMRYYNIRNINAILYEMDQKIIGRSI